MPAGFPVGEFNLQDRLDLAVVHTAWLARDSLTRQQPVVDLEDSVCPVRRVLDLVKLLGVR